MNHPFHLLTAAVLLITLAAGASFPAAAAPTATEIPALFHAAPAGTLAPQSIPAQAARARLVVLDLPILAQAAAAGGDLRLPFFDDATFTARITRSETTPSGGMVYTGKLAGEPESSVILSVQDGAIAASITRGTTLYQVTGSGSGLAWAAEMKPSAPEELDAAVPALANAKISTPKTPLTGDDDGSRIDVMVVYDQAAQTAAGGSGAIQAKITLAMTETNSGYLNSQINQRVTLVGGTANLIDYTEPSTTDAFGDWSTMLNYVTSSSNVAAMRDANHADEVVFLIGDTRYCGLAWMMESPFVNTMDFAPYGFAVVSQVCATGYYSFAHEMGHNMGANHDRPNASGTPAFNYSYGFYHNTAPAFRTIMAYGNSTNGCSACPRINYWSNPSLTYSGLPLGVAAGQSNSADNHLTLNNTAATVAKFRDGPPPAIPGGLSVLNATYPQVLLQWADNSSDETGFRVYRYSGTWVKIADLPANTTTYTDPANACMTAIKYRVTAYSGNGESAATADTPVPACTPPSTPATLTATPMSQIRINLSWSASTGIVSEYRLERSPDGSNGWVQIATTIPGVVAYSDASLVCNTPYFYRVIAHNSGGNSLPSSTANALTKICAPPDAPLNFFVSSLTSSTISLAWTDVDGETSFHLERMLGTVVQKGVDLPMNSTSYQDSGLLPHTAYTYRLIAHNANFPSNPDSAPVSLAQTTWYAVYLPSMSKK